jgi:hypothetical protein
VRALAICGESGRRIVEVWGQSNSNHGLWLSSTATNPLDRNEQQNVLYARHTRLNSGHAFEIDTEWGNLHCPDGPATYAPTAGLPTIGIAQVLGRVISQSIPNIAISQCSVGATASQYWADNYSGIYAPWLAARLAQLPGCTGALGVIYQGESNCSSDTIAVWRGHWEAIIAARRAAHGNPTMPWIIVRIAHLGGYANLPAMWVAQDALVAADPYVHLVNNSTAVSGAGPDIDTVSVQRTGTIIGMKARELLA